MKKILAFAVIALLASTAGADELYRLTVGEFSRLKVTDAINVDYRQSADSAGQVVFRADPSIASNIAFTPSGDELKINFTTDTRPRGQVPTVTVYSTFLTQVVNTADSTVRIMTVTPCPSFSAKQEGNGRIVVRNVQATRVSAKLMTGNGQVIVYGKADEASLSMTGTGLIQADGLEAKNVKVSATGTGQVGCWATEELKVSGAGSTKVYYRGTPKVKKSFAVGVKVEPLE